MLYWTLPGGFDNYNQPSSDDFIIWGRLSAQLFINRGKNAILNTLKEMIPERLTHTPFALMITTDEMQPAERDIYVLMEALNDLNKQYS